MYIFKYKYFLIIESIKDIDLINIRKRDKFIIIYRCTKLKDNIFDLQIFRRKCKVKFIKFFVANNYNLATFLKSDGIYLSSYNHSFKALNFVRSNYRIIGSAHNYSQIFEKQKQGCSYILYSKLFKVDYDPLKKNLGVIKFNNFLNHYKHLIPLGGINEANLNKVRIVRSKGLVLMSEIKKKPAIASRLF